MVSFKIFETGCMTQSNSCGYLCCVCKQISVFNFIALNDWGETA